MSVETVQLYKSGVQSEPLCVDTFMQSITPPIHCSVNNILIKVTPVFNQLFFQTMFDAINVLVTARSATSSTAGVTACDPIVLCNKRFTKARDLFFLESQPLIA